MRPARPKWLLAAATAFFVLQAPLCALACVSSEAVAAPSAEAHQGPPCHEEAPSQVPTAPTGTDEDCCDAADTALLTPPNLSFTPLHDGVFVTPQVARSPLAALAAAGPSTPPSETDLPPPDILLRDSILII